MSDDDETPRRGPGRPPNPYRGLTAKQEKFVQAFCVNADGNAARAARDAGYSPRNADVIATDLMKKPHIRAQIELRKRWVDTLRDPKKTIASVKRQEEFLTAVMEGKVYDQHPTKHGLVKLRAKAADRVRAAEQLGKRQGAFAPTKTELTGPNGAPVSVALIGTPEEIEAMAALTEEDIAADDDSTEGDS